MTTNQYQKEVKFLAEYQKCRKQSDAPTCFSLAYDVAYGGVSEMTKKEYDAYMNNPDNFCEDEVDPNEPTPSQMNEELRRGGW